MGVFDDKVREQTKGILEEMKEPLELLFFTQEKECELCGTAAEFVDELTGLDDRLHLEKKDFLRDKELAQQLGIHHVPAIALRRAGEERYPIRYFGVPGGYEFGAFLRTLVLLSAGKGDERVNAAEVRAIEKPVNLKVFVLVTCPSCPVMVFLANTLASMNGAISTEIIEANTFEDLAGRFTVGTVPKIVINDTAEVVGVLPPRELLKKIQGV